MIWRKAESAVRPVELDTASSKTVNYIRKNIIEVEREEPEGTTIVIFEYDELAVPKADWELFKEMQELSVKAEKQERALAGNGETLVAKNVHSIGEYITVDGVFCEVIAKICVGEKIIFDRNVKQANIGSVLKGE